MMLYFWDVFLFMPDKKSKKPAQKKVKKGSAHRWIRTNACTYKRNAILTTGPDVHLSRE